MMRPYRRQRNDPILISPAGNALCFSLALSEANLGLIGPPSHTRANPRQIIPTTRNPHNARTPSSSAARLPLQDSLPTDTSPSRTRTTGLGRTTQKHGPNQPTQSSKSTLPSPVLLLICSSRINETQTNHPYSIQQLPARSSIEEAYRQGLSVLTPSLPPPAACYWASAAPTTVGAYSCAETWPFSSGRNASSISTKSLAALLTECSKAELICT